MDLSNIKELIATFRLETEKNSISPDRVGYLLLLLTSIFDDIQSLVKEGDNALNKNISALQDTLQVVQTAIDALRGDKQDKLAPGRGIAISDNVISCTLDTEVFRLVSELPTQDIDENKIYLVAVAGDDAEDNNVYQEWHYKGGEWELIGARKVEVNLTPYLTKEDAVKKYQPKGEYASQSDYDELSETVAVIDESVAGHTNNSDIHITQAEKAALCIYPFEAIVYNPAEAYGKYKIAYSVKLKQFISVANDSYTIKGGPYESRDNLYRIGGVLYKFENDTLVEIYQPKGNYDKYVAQTDIIIGGQGFCGVGLTTGEEFDIDTVAAVISGEVGDTSIKDIYCQDGMLFYFRSSGGYQLWRLNDSANAYPVTENNWERIYLMTSKSFVYDESTNTLNIITQ